MVPESTVEATADSSTLIATVSEAAIEFLAPRIVCRFNKQLLRRALFSIKKIL